MIKTILLKILKYSILLYILYYLSFIAIGLLLANNNITVNIESIPDKISNIIGLFDSTEVDKSILYTMTGSQYIRKDIKNYIKNNDNLKIVKLNKTENRNLLGSTDVVYFINKYEKGSINYYQQNILEFLYKNTKKYKYKYIYIYKEGLSNDITLNTVLIHEMVHYINSEYLMKESNIIIKRHLLENIQLLKDYISFDDFIKNNVSYELFDKDNELINDDCILRSIANVGHLYLYSVEEFESYINSIDTIDVTKYNQIFDETFAHCAHQYFSYLQNNNGNIDIVNGQPAYFANKKMKVDINKKFFSKDNKELLQLIFDLK